LADRSALGLDSRKQITGALVDQSLNRHFVWNGVATLADSSPDLIVDVVTRLFHRASFFGASRSPFFAISHSAIIPAAG